MDQQEEATPDEAADTLTIIAVCSLLFVLAVVAWQIASLQP
jgi:hypothetical protein